MPQNEINLENFCYHLGYQLPRYQIDALALALDEHKVTLASVGFGKLTLYRSENYPRVLRHASNEGLWLWASWDMVAACYRARGQWGEVSSRSLVALTTWGVPWFRSPAEALAAL